MKRKRISKRLQAILWSADIKDLDLQKHKGYIIHQIFSYGNLEDIKWVLANYPKKEIANTFKKVSYKDYRAARFFFVKDYILSLRNFHPDERLYVKNIPRAIG